MALQRILHIRMSYRRPAKLFTFRDLFSMTRIFDCSDNHDRVYGLLGLVEPSDAEELHVDHTESLEGLALRMSRHLIGKGLRFYVLLHSTGPKAVGPSWVFDLARTSTDSLSNFIDLDRQRDFYNACGPTRPEVLNDLQTDEVVIYGSLLDSVAEMTTVLVDMRLDQPDSQTLRLAWQLEVSEWVANHVRGSDSFSLKCRTSMIADVLWLSTTKPQRGTQCADFKSHVQAYEAYIDMFKENEAGRRKGAFMTEESVREISMKAEP
jgi:hypothetical protein